MTTLNLTRYSFDVGSGAYTGEALAHVSPARPTNTDGTANILEPANSTPVAPPAATAGFAAVWNGAAWSLVEDHRGVTMYSTVDGHTNSMVALGPVPVGYTLLAPPSNLYSWIGNAWVQDLAKTKTAKLAQINAGADQIRAQVLAQYSQTERDSFPLQVAEANGWTANNATPTPTISAIAAAVGSTVDTLVPLILQNAAFLIPVISQAQLYRKQLQAIISDGTATGDATAIAAVGAINPLYALPAAATSTSPTQTATTS